MFNATNKPSITHLSHYSISLTLFSSFRSLTFLYSNSRLCLVHEKEKETEGKIQMKTTEKKKKHWYPLLLVLLLLNLLLLFVFLNEMLSLPFKKPVLYPLTCSPIHTVHFPPLITNQTALIILDLNRQSRQLCARGNHASANAVK